MTIGERIRDIRKSRNMAQKALAEKLGVSSAMVAQYEAGKRNPKYETLKKFADALDVNVLYLIDEEQNADEATDDPVSEAIRGIAEYQPNLQVFSKKDFYTEIDEQIFSNDLYDLHSEISSLNRVGFLALIAYAKFLTTVPQYVIGDDDRYYKPSKNDNPTKTELESEADNA